MTRLPSVTTYMLSRHSDRRATIAALVSPAILTFLFLLVSPLVMVTEERGISNNSAKNSITAWLARPSTGGAVRASFNASPITPVIAFLRARGWILMENDIPFEDSVTGIMGYCAECRWSQQHDIFLAFAP